MKKFLGRLLMFLIVTAGAAYLLFPFASDQYLLYQNEALLKTYRESSARLDGEKAEEIKQALADWNSQQTQSGLVIARVIRQLRAQDPFHVKIDGGESPSDLLYTDANGVAGILEIPKISLTLPVYARRTEEHIASGLFWGPGSSLPVGGLGTHAMLAGSGGLAAPGALGNIGLKGPKMLEDLELLSEGDLFLFSCLDQTLVYRIEQIVKAPSNQTILLERSYNEDKMSLVSATRDGLRLIVSGTRADLGKSGGELLEANKAYEPGKFVRLMTFGAPVLALGLLVMFIVERVMSRRYRLPTEIK
ncbi:MAG: sortase [Clostridia bacterium]|nr:sortase [Clostridia bacterium]